MERQEERDHGRAHAQDHAGLPLQTIFSHDGVGHEGIGRHDTSQQERCCDGESEYLFSCEIGHEKGNQRGEQAEGEHSVFVLLQSLHVHFQGGEEHDIVKSHLAEELKRGVALQYVQPIWADEHPGNNHSNDVRNAQLTHDDRCKEDDQEHHEESQGGVGDGKVLLQAGHE